MKIEEVLPAFREGRKIASFDGKYRACDCGFCMSCIAKEALEGK